MNIFDILYTKILDTKEKLNKNNGFVRIQVNNNSIVKNNVIDFTRSASMPLSTNTSCIYLYDDILRTLMVNGSYVIDVHKNYTLMDFMSITKTMLLVFSDGKVVDPALISLYITRERMMVLTIKENITNVEILVSKGITSCNRYTVNISITLDIKYLNSYVIYTDGYADYVTPVINGSTFTLSLSAQNKTMIVVVSNFIKMYKATPESNAIYNYINFLDGVDFIATDYIFIHEQGVAGYVNPSEYTQLYDGFLTTNTNEKIVVCFLRYGIGKYEDIRNYYNTFKDFTAEYIAGTLPQYLQDYAPYVPLITEGMSFTDLKTELIKACKDLPNFYRGYLESNNQFNITEKTILPIISTFERNSIINTDIGINVPRYTTGIGLDCGIIVEDTITNLVSDPLFADEIASSLSNSNWSIPLLDTITAVYETKNGVLHHRAILADYGIIKLTSPKITFDKTKDTIIQFKIKYDMNTMWRHDLTMLGGIVDNNDQSILQLDSYLIDSKVVEDGFTHKIYKIPANTLIGSTNDGYIGLWGDFHYQYERVDYYLKDFQITNTSQYPYFYPGIKAAESLKLSNANILSKTEGSVELWVKPRSYNKNGYLLYSTGNDAARDFSIYHTDTGRLVFNIIGTTIPPHSITSEVNAITYNTLNYIVVGWKNNILYGYINGILIGTTTITDEPGIGLDIMIGSKSDKTLIGDFSYHDIRFSSILRTSQEISTIYNNKNELVVDEYTSYRIPFDTSILPDKDINHPTTMIFKTDPAYLLMFNNQLNVSPAKIVRQSNSSFIAHFRATDITDSNIYILDIGRDIVPFYMGLKVTDQTIKLYQSQRIKNDDDIAIYITGNDVKSTAINQRIYTITQAIDGYLYAGIDTVGKVYKYNPIDLSVEIESLFLAQSISSIAITSDNKIIVGAGHKLFCLNANTLAIELESIDFGGDIIKVCIDANDSLYMIGGSDQTTVKKLNVTDFSIVATSSSYGGSIHAITIGSNGGVYIGGDTIQKVYKLNSSLIKEAESVDFGGTILVLTTGINNSVYVAGDTHKVIMQLSEDSLDKISQSVLYLGTIQAMCIGNDGSVFASITEQSTCRVYKYSPKLLYLEDTDDYGGIILDICKGFDNSIYICGESNKPIIKYDIMTLVNVRKQYFEKVTNFTHSFNNNILTINFADSSIVGKNIHISTKRYNRLVNKSHSENGLITLPTWASFVDVDNIMTFLNGYHISNTNAFVFNPYEYRVIGEDTVLSVNIDTDTVAGETINVLLSSEMEHVEQITIIDDQKIIELTDKSFPFSDKYNLIFADGKFVPPSKIKIIDTYRFSIDIDSIHDIQVYRKKLNFEYNTDFNALVDKWSEFLATLQMSDIENIIGPLFSAKDTENNARTPVLAERHLFEILYWYVMKDKTKFTFIDNFNIREDLSDIFTADGRIPLSNIRSGHPPRYIL